MGSTRALTGDGSRFLIAVLVLASVIFLALRLLCFLFVIVALYLILVI